ncbi:Sodium/proline symporter OS=Lysinibacillus sphaericus OX=1421 GN=LS41612_02235 PE=3 SV=1 [Lysinibacillus sphaericus]
MVTGAATAFIWGKIKLLSTTLYEIVPGFLVCLIVAVVVSMVTYKRNAEIEEEFDRTETLLKKERG